MQEEEKVCVVRRENVQIKRRRKFQRSKKQRFYDRFTGAIDKGRRASFARKFIFPKQKSEKQKKVKTRTKLKENSWLNLIKLNCHEFSRCCQACTMNMMYGCEKLSQVEKVCARTF